MKKLLCLILITALLISSTTTKANAMPGAGFLSLGDSITNGYKLGGSHYTDECFVNILAENNDLKAVNRGIDGNKATGILAQLESGALDDDIKNARFVTITCGGNDLLHSLYSQVAEAYNAVYPESPIQETEVTDILANQEDPRNFTLILAAGLLLTDFSENPGFLAALSDYITTMNQVISYIKGQNENVVVIVATQYNPYRWFSGTYKSLLADPMEKCAGKLREAVMNNAAEGDYLIADVYTAFANSEQNLCNAAEEPMELDFHPTAEGHAVIAACFQEVIDQVEWPSVFESLLASAFSNDMTMLVLLTGLFAVGAFAGAIIYRKKRKAQ